MSLIESLEHLDQQALLAINDLVGNSYFDTAMVLASAKWFWLPFYGYLMYRLFVKFGLTNLLWICLSVFGLVTLTDQVSVHLFKDVFLRLRPCHDPMLIDHLILVGDRCGGQYGFVSSHAANVFGLAGFISLLLNRYSSWWNLMFVWAGVVSFSRVYLAVHYSTDVICGALLGLLIGCSFAFLIKNILKKA